MVKQFVFNFKLDADDRERLLALAWRLQRTQADTVRWLIRQATGGPHPGGAPAATSALDNPVAILGDWEEWGRGGGITNYESGITNGEGEKGRKGEREIAPSPLLPFSPAPLRPFSPAPEKEGPQ